MRIGEEGEVKHFIIQGQQHKVLESVGVAQD